MWLIPTSMSSAFAPERRCSMKEFASLCPKRGLWVTSSGKPLLREFSWRGWEMRRWSQHLFGADLLKISRAGSGVEQWTASLLASRVSRGALQENSKAKPTTDGYGQQSPGSSEPSSRPSFFLRMSQGSLLDEESIAYSETLPDSGSMRSGVLFPQPTWEPPISARESSSWPSTRAEDGESCGNHPNGASDSLTGVTRNWNTPTAISGEGAHLNMNWATPSASDSFRSRGGDRVDEMGLDQQARMFWPTPQAHDSQDAKTPEQIASMRARTGAGVSNLNEVADQWQTASAADCKRARQLWTGRGESDAPGAGEELADCRRERLEGVRGGGPTAGPARRSSGADIFAPGPHDPRWRDILAESPFLAPAIKSGFRSVAYGDAVVVDESRTDQLRAIGNGVVALQAGIAFAVLTRRFLT